MQGVRLVKGIGMKGWAFFTRIRTMLLLSYLVIILLCIALVGTISFYISYRSMSERVETSSLQIVRQIENNMDNDFQNKRNLLLAPYYSQEYIDGINAYPTMDDQERFVFRRKLGDLYLKSFNITPIRDFIRFQIYFSNGDLMNSSDNQAPWTSREVRESEWFQRTVASDGRVYFSSPPEGGQAGKNEAAAYASSILIRDFANPDYYIVVRVEYNTALFDSVGQNDSLSANSRLLILDENNRPIYASPGAREAAAETGLLSQLTNHNGKLWLEGEQDSQLVTYTRSDYSNWKIVLIMPKKDIFGPLDQIKTATLLTALIAFMVTFFISVLFGRSLTNPILVLYKTINRVKRGDFSVRVAVTRQDEIGLIASNFNDMQDELQQLIESKYINQIKLQQVELAMLHSQINPHFLYNTLDSIKAMADYYEAGKIGDMAQSLADMFRYNIKNTSSVVTLREELEQIEAYMSIQSIRFEDKITYEREIEEALLSVTVLKMTLQPLVENAVFHGIEPKLGRCRLRVSATTEGGHMRLTISDDGVGIDAERLRSLRERLNESVFNEDTAFSAEEGGIGIRNVYARYTIRFRDRFRFEIASEPGAGTAISLLIPLPG
ncbi:cache domain-containing sensor histidine kinase [Paenibacillus puerhi]|uniref:cache domain-containing sensor histidine kinase n=1 Tax=Paenibacillus puerhi TaxID=2692622 RepID=UPI001F20EE87|nr:sensor histidine kinase [Paenibacillus puerhi]